MLDEKSEKKLKWVHEDLCKVIRYAAEISPVEFIITEGVRTLEKQQLLFAQGATTTLNSRHLTGHAVDVAAKISGEIRWDWPLYKKIADAIKLSATKFKIPVEWGGDWKSFKDGPHFQLPWKQYPINKED